MDNFRETARCVTIWQTFLAVLGAVLLIALSDLEPSTGLLAGANFALLFALGLITAVNRLTVPRITRGQFWRALPPQKRPPGEAGLRMARAVLEETWLTFAKGATVVAIALAGLAYASHGVSSAAWAKAVQAPGLTQQASAGAAVKGYRRPLPIY